MIELDFAQLSTHALQRAQTITGLVAGRERNAGAAFVADALLAIRDALGAEELRRARRILPHTARLVLPIDADAAPVDTDRGLHRLAYALTAIRDAHDGPIAAFFGTVAADVAQLRSVRNLEHTALDELIQPWREDAA